MADPRINVVLGAKDEASKTVKGLRGQFERFKRDAVTGFGLGAGISVFNMGKQALGAVVDVMGNAVNAASDLEESQSKVQQVYTDSSREVLAWGENAAEAMGLSTQKALEAHSTFGNFTQALGMSEDEARAVSGAMVQLASDLASFNNQDIQEVLVSLRSGLAGEAEPMRRLGADVSAARVELELMEMGLSKVNGKFTEGQKVQGRYRAIMEDTVKAQGDFVRTSDGLANSQKKMAARMEDAMAVLGKALLPVVTAFTQFAADVIPMLVGALESVGDAFNDLQRLIDPSLAQHQDLLKMTEKVADELGVEASAIEEVLERRRQEAKVAEQREALAKNELATVKAAIVDARMLTESIEGQAIAIAEATGYRKDWIQTELASDQAAEDMARTLVGLTTVMGDASGEIEHATDVQTEAEREVRRLGFELQQQAHVANQWRADWSEAGRGIQTGVEETVKNVIGELQGMPVSMKHAITSGKSAVREGMQELRWAMEHPFAEGKYTKFLERKQRKANLLLNQALAEGKTDAAAKARSLVDSLHAELDKIGQRRYNVQVSVEQRGELTRNRRLKDTLPNKGGKVGRLKHHGGSTSAGRTYLIGQPGHEEGWTPKGPGTLTPARRLGGGGDVYLDGFLVGKVMDERMGRSYDTASRVTNYRRS